MVTVFSCVQVYMNFMPIASLPALFWYARKEIKPALAWALVRTGTGTAGCVCVCLAVLVGATMSAEGQAYLCDRV